MIGSQHLLTTLLAMCLVTPAAFAQQTQTVPPGVVVQSQVRFDGTVSLRAPQGKPRLLHVVIRQWLIHGRQQLSQFPERGLLMVHLHSGQVTTVIGKQEAIRKGGEFWTVPSGVAMALTVTSESALLETTAIP